MDGSFDKLTVQPSTSGSSASPSVSVVSSSSTSSSNNYFQRRFDGSKRRKELLEKISKNNSPTKITASAHRSLAFTDEVGPHGSQGISVSRISQSLNSGEDCEANESTMKPLSPPNLRASGNMIGTSNDTTTRIITDTCFSTPDRKGSGQEKGKGRGRGWRSTKPL